MAIWRVRSGCKHYLRVGGTGLRLIEAGQRFEADEDQVQGILDKIERVGDGAPTAPEPEMTRLEVRPRENARGWYDVVNSSTGETINDQGLRREEAEALAGG